MDDKVKRLKSLTKKILRDNKLPFKDSATQMVFGEGSLNPKIYFLGEAPGRNEDLTGKPFVGLAGKLLDKVLEDNRILREDCYITSVVYFRPPNNKTPTPSEVEAYSKYVNEQLEIIGPKVILTLGRTSMVKFLPHQMITKVHGRVFEIEWDKRRVKVMPMFHPAAALRNPEVKELFEEDFKKIPELLTE